MCFIHVGTSIIQSTITSTPVDVQTPTTSQSQSTPRVDKEVVSTSPHPTTSSHAHAAPFTVAHTQSGYKVSLQPRQYQIELAKRGINGENYIIFAETGTGKTLVAAMIMADRLEKYSTSNKGKRPKAVFVVKTVTLAQQQAERLQEYIPNASVECRTGKREEIGTQLYISDALEYSDIVVCTDGKLLDELRNKKVAMQEISLLIMDECHHANKNSIYAQIMHKYLEMKDRGATKGDLPQVIGMTATPGLEKNPGLNEAKVVDNLVTLCAHMDATSGIQSAREHVDEIKQYVKKNGESHFDSVKQGKQRQAFIKRVEDEMEECEKFLQFSSEYSRWSQQYSHAVKERRRELEESDNPDDRDRVSTVRLLECYSETLIRYMDLPCDQTMKVLDEYDDLHTSDSERLSDHERHLWDKLEKLKIDLPSLNKYENPILEKVERRLTDTFKNNPESKGIVFVRTREQAESINEWLSANESLNESLASLKINSAMLVGKTRGENGPTMSEEDQKSVVHEFRRGDCNVLVATSVAEEGLDIPQCNSVIRLHMSGAKSKAQMKGRARAEDSEIVTIVSSDQKSYRDMLSDLQLSIMERIIYTTSLPLSEQILGSKQMTIMDTVMKEKEMRKMREMSHPAKDVKLHCNKCKVFVCRGSDIYFIDKTNHHVVPSEDFSTLYYTEEHHTPGYLGGCDDPVVEKNYKIHCKGIEGKPCNQSWGVLGTSSLFEVPVLKCESFNFYIGEGRAPKNFRKWKARPFKASPLSEWLALEKEMVRDDGQAGSKSDKGIKNRKQLEYTLNQDSMINYRRESALLCITAIVQVHDLLP